MDEYIILRLVPYAGNDTWVDCGGPHLKEQMQGGRDWMKLLGFSGLRVMYVVVNLTARGVTTDWGYRSVSEAKSTIPLGKRCTVEAG